MAEKAKNEVTAANEEESNDKKEAAKVVKTNNNITPPKRVIDYNKEMEVIPKFTGTRFIGNAWYEFEEGVPTKVPLHVKKTLHRANAIRL